jgi:hypothetical protein
MNQVLMENIVQHIFANLGLISTSYARNTQSLIDKNYKLADKKLSFYNGTQEVHRPVYGAQVKIGDKEFKIIAGDCSLDSSIPEYCVVVQLTGLPAYGMYMVCDPHSEPEALIAVTVNNQDWMPCVTFLQATLLAAMEQLRDVGMGWQKCTNYQEFYQTLVTMIKFHTNYYEEANNEGQESRS